MREFVLPAVLQVARVLVLVVMIIYLPVFWLAGSIAAVFQRLQDALDLKLLLLEAEKRHRARSRL